jgi:hypothetical protein
LRKKLLPKVLLTSVVAFAAVACGGQPVSKLTSVGSDEQPRSLIQLTPDQKNESILAFALACVPVTAGTPIKSARVWFDSGKAELRLDSSDAGVHFGFAGSKLVNATANSLEVSWPADQVSFKASLEKGRVFNGELTQGNEVSKLSCYKIITAERDADEFSLVCIPATSEQAYVESLGLDISDVVLSWEDSGLEMIVNPTSQSLIYDFERADGVEVSSQIISARWNLEQASFHGESEDGIKFDGQLAYEGQSTIPLICWKL